ncbi:MAG TPA: tetratricopeptide repeat protein [Candidatus Kapabacteria bacterium]|nr:tetratricopeptide repeat protein [Candidatus Kapabacteria bacterium]
MRISKILVLIILVNATALFGKKDSSFELGNKALKKRDYKAAVLNFTKSINDKKELKLSYYKRGLSNLYLNEFNKAIADFSETIKIDSTMPEAYNNLGLSYSYLGNTLEALRNLDKAISLDNKFGEAYVNRANVFILRTDYPNAKNDLDTALILDPNNPECYFQLGKLNYILNKYKESSDNFTQAIKLGIKNSKIYYNRANSLFKLGNLKEALQDYTQSLELNPYDMEALNNRAYTYKALGLDSLAEIDRSKILEANSDILTPVDSLKFKTFTNQTKDLSIDLPDTWHIVPLPEQNGLIQFIITPEQLDPESSSMHIGVTVGIMKNMSHSFPVKNEPDILDFWKGSLDETNKDYLSYEVIWQRHNQWFGHGSILNESYLQVGENFMPFKLYEYAIAYGNNLIFIYMQSPELTFHYYKQIYDKALESLRLGNNYKLE